MIGLTYATLSSGVRELGLIYPTLQILAWSLRSERPAGLARATGRWKEGIHTRLENRHGQMADEIGARDILLGRPRPRRHHAMGWGAKLRSAPAPQCDGGRRRGLLLP